MLLISGLVVACAVMLIAWGHFVVKKNLAIVDVFWGIAITGACVTYYFSSSRSLLSTITLALIVLWMTRLSTYLYLSRIKKNHKDKRYEAMRAAEGAGGVITPLFTVFFLQASLAWLVGIGFFFTSQSTSWSPVNMVVLLIMTGAIIGETIADGQLAQHKKNHQGTLCDNGLWAYSRHPNLFFDWLFWLAVATLGVTTDHGWLAIISPLSLFLIMRALTIPLTEQQSLKSRGDVYKRYQQTVSCFFPRPAKKDRCEQ